MSGKHIYFYLHDSEKVFIQAQEATGINIMGVFQTEMFAREKSDHFLKRQNEHEANTLKGIKF